MRKKLLVMLMLVCGTSSLVMAQAKKPAATKNDIQASIARGEKVYTAQCLVCHQADGGGVLNMNPPLSKTKYVLGDKTKLIQILLKGLSGEIEINGDTYHNNMPAKNTLTDAEIADVLTYVRNSFGNKASAVSPSQVKTVRAKTK